MNSNKRPIIIAHRGASGSAPENTLASIQKSLEIGVEMVEIDVHQSLDGEVVVIHDKTLNRTTNGKGKVREFTLEQLKKLDAGYWFSNNFKGETIPTLEEVVKLVKGKAELLIEIKNSALYPGIEKRVIEILEENDCIQSSVIHAFEIRCLERVRKLNKQVKIQKLVLGNIFFLPIHFDVRLQFGRYNKYQYGGINPNHKFVTKKMLDLIHRSGQTVYVWTSNDEEQMRELIGLGIDGIITDYPEKLKALLATSD